MRDQRKSRGSCKYRCTFNNQTEKYDIISRHAGEYQRFQIEENDRR